MRKRPTAEIGEAAIGVEVEIVPQHEDRAEVVVAVDAKAEIVGIVEVRYQRQTAPVSLIQEMPMIEKTENLCVQDEIVGIEKGAGTAGIEMIVIAEIAETETLDDVDQATIGTTVDIDHDPALVIDEEAIVAGAETGGSAIHRTSPVLRLTDHLPRLNSGS
jgi:hypothetical protein